MADKAVTEDSPSNALLGQLVRIPTSDGLELQGLLYKPSQKTNKILVHLHGWTGNFYENVFLDYIARACLAQGYSFLSFNTRGAGFVQEFLKKKDGTVEYIKIGGSLERFEDCLIDIDAVINFLEAEGYSQFILEGHSTGCQKAAYYTVNSHNPHVKGLVFLEPADDPSIVKKILADRYEEAMKYARSVLPDQPMPDWIPFGVRLSAQKFLSIADPHSTEGGILHLPADLGFIQNLVCPLLAISAENSEYQEATTMQKRLCEVVKATETHIIPDSGHWFFDHEKETADLIGDWLVNLP